MGLTLLTLLLLVPVGRLFRGVAGPQRPLRPLHASLGDSGEDAVSKEDTHDVIRLFQVEIPASEDPGPSFYGVSEALGAAVAAKLSRLLQQSRSKAKRSDAKANESDGKVPFEDIMVVRKSVDARRPRRRRPTAERGKSGTEDGLREEEPRFSYVVDVRLGKPLASRVKYENGKVERLELTDSNFAAAGPLLPLSSKPIRDAKTVVIVGAGPAGYFAALEVVAAGHRCVVLERGQGVERRGKDIGALMHRKMLNPESNLCYGEGGAGTWSDGKLTTRIGRNSEDVRHVLELLVALGAPSEILVSGKPHLGTDRLVRILKAMRLSLQSQGAEVLFGTRMEDLVVKGGKAVGVMARSGNGELFEVRGDAVILAPGHSARDLYGRLLDAGVHLVPKGFAVGFRVEHPQALINKIRYRSFAGSVRTGKRTTDAENLKANPVPEDSSVFERLSLPTADYRLAETLFTGLGSAEEQGPEETSSSKRGVFSFCMCPGGQIVPTSTDPAELCINGMSFSRRDSRWANSALVVTVGGESDSAFAGFVEDGASPLAGVDFQIACERAAARMGGGNFVAPVQRVPDFLEGSLSRGTLPSSSYRLGVRSAALHEIYPEQVTAALRLAVERFEKKMPGFVCSDALLHGVETRTSAPVTIQRDRDTLEAKNVEMLFPAGEGAGYAGGIVSAAVDGIRVAKAVVMRLGAPKGAGEIAQDK